MELVNEMYASEAKLSQSAMEQIIRILTLMLAPFAPYLAQELWEEQGSQTPVFKESWPAWDPDLAREDEVEIVVQINGKVRHRMNVPAGLDQVQLAAMAEDNDQVQALIGSQTVVKIIAVPGKLRKLVIDDCWHVTREMRLK